MAINRLPWRKKLRTSAANNLDKINEIIDYINTSDISPVMLSDSGTGRVVTAGRASSLASLTVNGESTQDGTPAPDAPVDVECVEGANGASYITLVCGETATPIDLQGNQLCSLPDGTRDVLRVDAAGHCMLEKNVGVATLDGNESETWAQGGTATEGLYRYRVVVSNCIDGRAYGASQIMPIISNRFSAGSDTGANGTYSNRVGVSIRRTDTSELWFYHEGESLADFKTWLADNPVTVYYPLAAPAEIDLGRIAMPAVGEGDNISIAATIVPEITASWWMYEDITNIIDALINYIDLKTAETNDESEALSMSRLDLPADFGREINITNDDTDNEEVI